MNDQQALNDILEIVQFLKEKTVTREEAEEMNANLKNELITHIDGFIVLHQNSTLN